jgi:hypothetical protein
MASAQIRADIVITACEKYISETEHDIKTDKQYCKDNNLQKREFMSFFGKTQLDTVSKIKKLAEYVLKGAPEAIIFDPSPYVISITHNDYELLGEFL